MVNILNKISLSFQTFKTHKMRSFLTTLGIVIGVMTVIAILSLIEGLNRSVAEQIQSLGSDLIYLQKFSWISTGGPRDLDKLAERPDLTPEDAEKISQLPSVEHAIPEISRRLTKLKYRDNEVSNVTIVGSEEQYAWINNYLVESGRDLSRDDVLHRRKVCIVGSYIATNLFPDESPIGKDLYLEGHRVRIIGVFQEKGQFLGNSLDDFILIPRTVYEKWFPRDRTSIYSRVYGGYSIGVKSKIADIDKTIDDIRELMRRRHGLTFDEEDDFEINTQQLLLELYQNLTKVGFIAIVAIAAISLLVGGIGIMNIMLVSVAERTREIGIRKAVGASNQYILSQFLVESVVLALIGGVIGIAIGTFLAFVISVVSPLKAAVSLWMIALGFGFSASVGIFFGIYPARKAASLNPIEALRYE
jgi:putative ABC transport system permease protein